MERGEGDLRSKTNFPYFEKNHQLAVPSRRVFRRGFFARRARHLGRARRGRFAAPFFREDRSRNAPRARRRLYFFHLAWRKSGARPRTGLGRGPETVCPRRSGRPLGGDAFSPGRLAALVGGVRTFPAFRYLETARHPTARSGPARVGGHARRCGRGRCGKRFFVVFLKKKHENSV